jgi:hypothetical protein
MMMLWLLQRHLGGLGGYRISRSLFKALAAALVSGLVAYGVSLVGGSFLSPTSFLPQLAGVALPGLAGLAAFIAAVLVLDMEEVNYLWQIIRRRKS